jgi:hypothetical protein
LGLETKSGGNPFSPLNALFQIQIIQLWPFPAQLNPTELSNTQWKAIKFRQFSGWINTNSIQTLRISEQIENFNQTLYRIVI